MGPLRTHLISQGMCFEMVKLCRIPHWSETRPSPAAHDFFEMCNIASATVNQLYCISLSMDCAVSLKVRVFNEN